MDRDEFHLTPNHLVFCDKRWKPAAVLLGTAVLLTFLWALYLLGISLDDYTLDDYSIEHHPTHILQGDGSAAQPVAGELDVLQRKLTPAIVHIHGRGQLQRGQGVPSIISSGVIVHPAGYLITTAHGLAGHHMLFADVPTDNGLKRYEASLIKTDPLYDVALLKINTNDRFLFLKIADTTQMPQGTPLYAFGLGHNSSIIGKQGGLQQRGVMVQAGNQSLSRLFKTDAVYSWEQTGGALVTGGAELAGINLAMTGASGTVLGYAIPAHLLQKAFSDELSLAAATSVQAMQVAAWPVFGVNMAATTTSPAAPGTANVEHQSSFTISGHSIESAIGLVLLGLAAGITGGMISMGGGIILVSGMLIFFGYGMGLIRPVSFITNVFTYGAAALRNRSSGLVMWSRVMRLIPWAIGGVIIGYLAGSQLDDQMVGYLLGIFALLIAAKTLHEIFQGEEEEKVVYSGAEESHDTDRVEDEPIDALLEMTDDNQQAATGKRSTGILEDGILGVPMGLVSGVLGISGGVVEVPLQRYFSNISIHNAIANSSVMVFWASLAAAVVSLVHGHAIGAFEWQTPIGIALIMVPSAYIGGMMGAKMLRHIPADKLKWIYVALMLVIGIRMLFGQ